MYDLVLICGYMRTGKDALCSSLMGIKRFNWRIYSKGERLYPNSDYKRFAFADKLKKEAAFVYSIPVDIKDKDYPGFQVNGKKCSARDLYIEWAKHRKNTDSNYWCKDILKQSKCIVSDWRFLNELDFITIRFSNIATVRVFRKDVPIPPLSAATEHELDKELTDFLVVPDDDLEFISVIKHFPQYNGYFLTGYL